MQYQVQTQYMDEADVEWCARTLPVRWSERGDREEMCEGCCTLSQNTLHVLGFLLLFATVPGLVWMLVKTSQRQLIMAGETEESPYASVGNYTLVVPPDVDFNQSWLLDIDIHGVQFKHLTLQRDMVNISRELSQNSSNLMNRHLTFTQKEEQLLLLDRIKRLFADQGVEWFLFYGSLLGSYVSHDVLAWDDDVDILVDHSALKKLQALQGNLTLANTYGLCYVGARNTHKLFFNSSTHIKNYPWSWPFMDIVFTMTNASHVWNLDQNKPYHQFTVPRELVYPTHLRPFAYHWMPAPRQPWAMLSISYRNSYSHFRCVTGGYNHVKESSLRLQGAACSNLREVYPFVWRQPLAQGTLETLWLGQRPLYSVIIVGEDFYPGVNPFEWKFAVT